MIYSESESGSTILVSFPLEPPPSPTKADNRRLCFIIGPIGASRSSDRIHADLLLKEIIRPVFRKAFRNFKLERADHIAKPGMIDSQVITLLIEADLVIADLTTRNANAFYELGIRHMIQKPVIHVYKIGETIPFDIQPYRAIEFGYGDKRDIRDARSLLRRTIQETLSPEFHLENPVTRSRGMIRRQGELSKRRADLLDLVTAAQTPVSYTLGQLTVLTRQLHGAKSPTISPHSLDELMKHLDESTRRAEALYQAIRELDE